jgi:hypothetical protein
VTFPLQDDRQEHFVEMKISGASPRVVAGRIVGASLLAIAEK